MRHVRGSKDRDPSDFVRTTAKAFRRALPGIFNDAALAAMFGIGLWIASMVMGELSADTRARAVAQSTRRMPPTSQMFCERWGIAPGSREFALCAQDLDRIRSSADWRRQLFTPF